MTRNSSPAFLTSIETIETKDPNVLALIPFKKYRDPEMLEKEFDTTWCGLPVRVAIHLWGRSPHDHHELASVTILDGKGSDVHELDLNYLDDGYEEPWLNQIAEGVF